MPPFVKWPAALRPAPRRLLAELRFADGFSQPFDKLMPLAAFMALLLALDRNRTGGCHAGNLWLWRWLSGRRWLVFWHDVLLLP